MIQQHPRALHRTREERPIVAPAPHTCIGNRQLPEVLQQRRRALAALRHLGNRCASLDYGERGLRECVHFERRAIAKWGHENFKVHLIVDEGVVWKKEVGVLAWVEIAEEVGRLVHLEILGEMRGLTIVDHVDVVVIVVTAVADAILCLSAYRIAVHWVVVVAGLRVVLCKDTSLLIPTRVRLRAVRGRIMVLSSSQIGILRPASYCGFYCSQSSFSWW